MPADTLPPPKIRTIAVAAVILRGELRARPELARCAWCVSLDEQKKHTLWSVTHSAAGLVFSGAILLNVSPANFETVGQFRELDLPQ